MSKRNPWHRLLFWLMWPGLFVYFRASRRTRLVIVSGNHILLIKGLFKIWFDDDRLTVPGGGLRRFESPVKGAVRELQEELGVTVAPEDLRPLWSGKIGEHGLKYKSHFLLLRLPRSTKLQLQKSEIAAAEWHAISDLQPQALKAEARRALALLAGKP